MGYLELHIWNRIDSRHCQANTVHTAQGTKPGASSFLITTKHAMHHTSPLWWRKKLERELSLHRCRPSFLNQTCLPSRFRPTWATWAASINRHACAVDEPEIWKNGGEQSAQKPRLSRRIRLRYVYCWYVGMLWSCGRSSSSKRSHLRGNGPTRLGWGCLEWV